MKTFKAACVLLLCLSTLAFAPEQPRYSVFTSF
jgi:hypothetical protein